jgi:hypothetical protein
MMGGCSQEQDIARDKNSELSEVRHRRPLQRDSRMPALRLPDNNYPRDTLPYKPIHLRLKLN